MLTSNKYMLKLNDTSTKRCENMFKGNNKEHQCGVNGVVTVPFLLTLNIFNTLFQCLYE